MCYNEDMKGSCMMNKLELAKVMEYFNYKCDNNVYYVNNLALYHDNRYFTIVNGLIPYELASYIYSKYDNNYYLIRVKGNNQYEKPTSDVYTYHIDTVEGLAVFILEYENYINNVETTKEEVEDLLIKVNQYLLKNYDLNLSVYEHMLNQDNRFNYFNSVLNNKTIIDYKLRKKIEEYDDTIMPFLNNKMNVEDSEFIVNIFTNEDYKDLYLKDNYSDEKLKINLDKNEFYLVYEKEVEEPYICNNVYHYFYDNKEIIAFEEFRDDDHLRLEYNLTDKTFGKQYEEKHPAKVVDKEYVINKLNEVIISIKELCERNKIGNNIKVLHKTK